MPSKRADRPADLSRRPPYPASGLYAVDAQNTRTCKVLWRGHSRGRVATVRKRLGCATAFLLITPRILRW
ncbi:hypothetical protein PAXRUDRAFT_826201 [Paxillus rubicundulus Ve08.2h10]|uniref:Uncharacterized protein n=1 Tax=Paxillus rubicundulus Ve08.2h10 TaxID=930991 RepID=A0A0D0DF10_9AGAM|nr:hypothetical protein PAXRUDRAFT_826201 [Paxillus rubicundulus Ve08.2h10]